MAKGGLQRQRFAERQQRNRIVAEQNANYQAWAEANADASGRPPPIKDFFSQVNAAKAQQVTITDKDNLSTIAAANGTTEIDILNANPDMTTPKTGMVVNIPGSEAWRAQGYGGMSPPKGGIGLPSAGPLGAAPGGLSTYQDQTQTRPGAWNPNAFATPAEQYANPQRQYGPPRPAQRPYGPPAPTSPGFTASLPGQTTLQQRIPTMNAPQQPPRGYGPPVATPTTNQPVTPGLPRKTWFAPRGNHVTLLDRITRETSGPGSRLPTEFEMKLLINAGRANPTGGNNNYFGGGGGYGNSRRRGGRGGGGGNRGQGGGGRPQSEPRMPAFSTGSGFKGLINWRI